MDELMDSCSECGGFIWYIHSLGIIVCDTCGAFDKEEDD